MIGPHSEREVKKCSECSGEDRFVWTSWLQHFRLHHPEFFIPSSTFRCPCGYRVRGRIFGEPGDPEYSHIAMLVEEHIGEDLHAHILTALSAGL